MRNRIDIMKSLLRSAASETSEQLQRLSAAAPVRRVMTEVLKGRTFISDAQLTAALARVPAVSAVTVSTHALGMSIDAGFRDGSSLLVCMVPEGITFAPHGAKEWRVRVQPSEAALDPRSVDLVVALASEIARTLWSALLVRQSEHGKTTFVNRDGDLLIVDLRTLAEVRAALAQRLRAAGMETVSLQAITAEEGGLRLIPKLAGM